MSGFLTCTSLSYAPSHVKPIAFPEVRSHASAVLGGGGGFGGGNVVLDIDRAFAEHVVVFGDPTACVRCSCLAFCFVTLLSFFFIDTATACNFYNLPNN